MWHTMIRIVAHRRVHPRRVSVHISGLGVVAIVTVRRRIITELSVVVPLVKVIRHTVTITIVMRHLTRVMSAH